MEPDERTRSARRIRSLVYAVFVAFAAAFVLLSVKELVTGVFGLREAPPAAAPGTPERACADGIRALARALDRGAHASIAAVDEKDAVAKMRAALAPEWDREQDLAAQCAKDPRGAEAWAELVRLERAEEGAAGRRATVLGPLRADVERLAPVSPAISSAARTP